MTLPQRIIFAGSGEFGLPSLKSLFEANYDLVQVVTQPDRPAGRGRSLTPTPIAAFATEKELQLLKTANINAETLPPADLMLVIAFGQKVAPHIVDHPRFGSINLHASRLPKYRGAAPINWAIIRGEQVTGNSIIRLAQKMDAGAILAQSEVFIRETETAGELHDRLADTGADMVYCVAAEMLSGIAYEQIQDESLASLAPKLSREQATIDFTRPADEIARLIRGMYPWPGCTVQLNDTNLTLARACPAGETSLAPGSTTDEGIAAGDGRVVEILELKPQGGRVMPLAAFKNGHPWQGLRVTKQSLR